MDARHVVAGCFVLLAFAAGRVTTAPEPTPPAPPVSTVAAPVVEHVPAPLPTSCRDAARALTAAADVDGGISTGAGDLQLAIDRAERALQDADYPEYNKAMRQVRDVRTTVALAMGKRGEAISELTYYMEQCSTDTSTTTE